VRAKDRETSSRARLGFEIGAFHIRILDTPLDPVDLRSPDRRRKDDLFATGEAGMRTTKVMALATVMASVAASFAVGLASGQRRGSGDDTTTLPGFSRVVSLSHTNVPARTPLFPGDPAFTLTTVATVADDGYYMQYVREGEHTGTHFSAPCHFREGKLCAEDLDAADFVLPLVVVDVRDQVAADAEYEVTKVDLQAWETTHGQMPSGAAVVLWTGCGRFWGPDIARDDPTYYNCGQPGARFSQPGFSKFAVRWLIETGVLAKRGALGTDTFGPDPSSDALFMESWLALNRHRFTLENLTNLGEMPATGGWIVIGGPRNRHGSGSASTIFGLVP
jgi:kynurenine formamidase